MEIEEKDLIAFRKIKEDEIDILNVFVLSSLHDSLQDEVEDSEVLKMANYVMNVWLKDENNYDICCITDIVVGNWEYLQKGNSIYKFI